MSYFQINNDHKRWIDAAHKKYRHPKSFWEDLIKKQNGRCALTDAKLLFGAKNGTPKKGGPGSHPLYAAVDHVKPQSKEHGFQILCYDINDLKGHLPPILFNALIKTEEWKSFVKEWKELAGSFADRQMFKELILAGTLSKK